MASLSWLIGDVRRLSARVDTLEKDNEELSNHCKRLEEALCFTLSKRCDAFFPMARVKRVADILHLSGEDLNRFFE